MVAGFCIPKPFAKGHTTVPGEQNGLGSSAQTALTLSGPWIFKQKSFV
jgi:hypothetical protein